MLPTTSVPPIYSPLPSAIHPRHERINQHTTAWAHELGIGSTELRTRLVQHDIGTFAARILPDGLEDVVAILGDFVFWLFGVDDGYCEENDIGTRPGELAMVLARLLHVAQHPQSAMLLDDPLAAGVRDLRRRIDRYATAGQAARWVENLRGYFLSVVCEAHYRGQRLLPDINDYTLTRLYDGATGVILPLLEAGHGYELQPHERDRTSVHAATEMTSFVIAWDNDVFSLHKESSGNRYAANAVRVLTRQYDLTVEQAVARVIDQRNRVLALFLDLREILQDGASPQLRQYLHALGTYIRAAQDWGATSSRYLWPDGSDLTEAFHLSLPDINRDPLDISAIGWWWDLPRSRWSRADTSGAPPPTGKATP